LEGAFISWCPSQRGHRSLLEANVFSWLEHILKPAND
jgi:hypothetical protein